MPTRRAAASSQKVITPIGVSVNTPRLYITSFSGHMVNHIRVFFDMGINKPPKGFTVRLMTGFIHHVTSIHLIIFVVLIVMQ